MSIQRRGNAEVVACDVCGALGALGDNRLRLVRRDAHGGPLHLCPDCRVWAEWCGDHQRFHMPDELHRCACAECGGLFTSRFRQHIRHCPSCLRALAPAGQSGLTDPSQRSQEHTRGLAGFFSTIARRR